MRDAAPKHSAGAPSGRLAGCGFLACSNALSKLVCGPRPERVAFAGPPEVGSRGSQESDTTIVSGSGAFRLLICDWLLAAQRR